MLKLHKLAGGIRKGPVEAKIFIPGLLSGIVGILTMNDRAETSVKNLYTAGSSSSATGSSGSKAVVWGLIVGDHMREIVPGMKLAEFDSEQFEQIKVEKERVMSPLNHSDGVVPLELEDYIRNVNMNYINIRKIEPRMKRALEIFKMAKEKAVPVLSAENPHELMRAIEVQDIIELSEIHARASLARTESRMTPCHYRVDYPQADDANWAGKIITVQNIKGEAVYTPEKLE
jgi:succinate dehydrogenase/fumarate reductase flavoprotein subunit